jgi:hypothetical protein
MKKILNKFLLTTLAASIIGAAPTVYAAESTGSATSSTFAAAGNVMSVLLPNPDRGLAQWTGSEMINNWDAGSISSGFSSGNRLGYCKLNLSAYKTTATLPGSVITSIQTRLANIVSLGQKCIMMPVYDDSSAGTDADVSIIVGHLSQLKSTFHQYAHAIAYAKAGFIGAYGEWWGSQAGNSCGYQGVVTCAVANPRRQQVRDALMDAYHPLTQIEFRYPDDHVQWWPTALSQMTAYRGTHQSRAGFQNDCQLSGGNDTGTWVTNSSGVSGAAQQTYMAAATNYMSYGGELSQSCNQTWRTSCAETIADWSKWHLTWIKDSASDASAWWNAWSSGGCFTQVRNMMGYRIQYDGISHQSSVTRGDSITGALTLRNTGWSRVHTPRRVEMVLVNGGTSIVCPSRVDLRALPPQATSTFNMAIPCTIPGGVATGTYSVYLRIPDIWSATAGNTNFAIRPTNVNGTGQTWDATNFRIGTNTTVTVN